MSLVINIKLDCIELEISYMLYVRTYLSVIITVTLFLVHAAIFGASIPSVALFAGGLLLLLIAVVVAVVVIAVLCVVRRKQKKARRVQ